MGNIFTNLFNGLFDSTKKIKIVMIGLDAAGKTTILYKLKLNQLIVPVPTIGFNVETIEYKNISFTIWDTGGGDKMRPLFRHYFSEGDSVIFVVDSTDRERIEEAAEFLRGFLTDGTTLLIFANKQDLPNAMNVNEIKEKLNLQSLNTQKWHIQECCACSGDGHYDGFDWLVKQINESSLK